MSSKINSVTFPLGRVVTRCTTYFADLVKQAQRDGVIVEGDSPDLTRCCG